MVILVHLVMVQVYSEMISVHKHLKKVIDMWYDLEKKNWESSGMDNKHIFISLHNIKEFIEREER